MKLEQLIDQFGLITDTQDGFKELRKAILDLALTGNLTLQKNDSNAEELFKKIKHERQELYEAGEIPKPKELEPISNSESLNYIPENWEWVKFGQIMDYQGGSQPPKSEFIKTNRDGYIRLLQIRDLGDSPQPVYVPKDSVTKFCSKDDIMVGRYGASIGKVFWGKDGAYNVALIRVIFGRENLDENFIYHFLNSSFFQDKVTGISRSAQAGFNKGNIFPIPVPLPPTEEQQRIVQKIETLFAQVEELEQKVEQDRQVDERLQLAVLNDLQRAETPEASRRSWQRLTDHFEQIYRKPEHIDQLKQAILNEAVRGRLVPQYPGDEPAEKLLERIKEEKQRLYDEGEIRKPKELSQIKDKEIPYDLPKAWYWCRLGTITHSMRNGIYKPSKFYNDHGTACLRMYNIEGGKVNYRDLKRMDLTEDEIESYGLSEGDLLVNRVNSRELVGKAAVIEGWDDDLVFESKNIRLKLPNDINPHFINLIFQTGYVNKVFDEYLRETTNQASINQTHLSNLLIPLPPLEEQNRVIDKLNELYTLCDDFKEQLSRSQQTDQRLLEALVQQATQEKEEPEENQEATILPFPKRRKVQSEIKDVSGMTTVDTQAGSMCRIFALYDSFEGDKQHFGRTKTEKANHIIESHVKINMGRMPKRMARGAADFQRLMNKVEYKAEKKGWFTATEINGVIHYRKGTRFEVPYLKLDQKLGDKATEVDRIIKLFIPLTTRDAEVRQTVYAAWHDLIAYGQNPSDDQIVEWSSTEKYWAEEKEDIPKEEFYGAIEWLRENDLVPDGKGKLTMK